MFMRSLRCFLKLQVPDQVYEDTGFVQVCMVTGSFVGVVRLQLSLSRCVGYRSLNRFLRL